MNWYYRDPSSPSRWDGEPLPDIEIFYLSAGEPVGYGVEGGEGWYYWHCLPGCLPDSAPIGPYGSEVEAVAAARAH